MGNTVKVNTQSLREYANRLDTVNRKLQYLDGRLDRLYGLIRVDGLGKLTMADYKIEYSKNLKYCSYALNQAANDFERCERNIVNFKNRHWYWSSGDWWSLIGSASTAGKFVSVFGSALTEQKNGELNWSVVKDTTSLVGKFITFKSSGKTFDWSSFVGLKKAEGTFKETFLDEIWQTDIPKEVDMNDVKAVNSAKTSRFFKNLGNVITVGEELVENWKENENKGRAILETVGESAVKIGLGALITAGLTAVGAPAIAIGVTTTIVTWGADAICKDLTEKKYGEAKGFDEVVSDFVIDNVVNNEKVGNAKSVVTNGILRSIGVTWKPCSALF